MGYSPFVYTRKHNTARRMKRAAHLSPVPPASSGRDPGSAPPRRWTPSLLENAGADGLTRSKEGEMLDWDQPSAELCVLKSGRRLTSYRCQLGIALTLQLLVFSPGPQAPDLQAFLWLQTIRNQDFCRRFNLSLRLYVALSRNDVNVY